MPKLSDGWQKSGEYAITNGTVSIVKAFVRGEAVYTLHFKKRPYFLSASSVGPFPTAEAAEEFWKVAKKVIEYGESRGNAVTAGLAQQEDS